jgi:hypothetical protein
MISMSNTSYIRDLRGGFYWANNEIVSHFLPIIGLYGFAVYTLLTFYANNETGECYPSIPTIATALGVSENTVRKALKILVSAGLISVEQRKSDTNAKTTNLYVLHDVRAVKGAGSPGEGGEVHQVEGGRFTGRRGAGSPGEAKQDSYEQDSLEQDSDDPTRATPVSAAAQKKPAPATPSLDHPATKKPARETRKTPGSFSGVPLETEDQAEEIDRKEKKRPPTELESLLKTWFPGKAIPQYILNLLAQKVLYGGDTYPSPEQEWATNREAYKAYLEARWKSFNALYPTGHPQRNLAHFVNFFRVYRGDDGWVHFKHAWDINRAVQAAKASDEYDDYTHMLMMRMKAIQDRKEQDQKHDTGDA